LEGEGVQAEVVDALGVEVLEGEEEVSSDLVDIF